MSSWESPQSYTLVDRRWYESPGRYLPGDEHLAVLRSVLPDGWRTRRRGLWTTARPPGADAPAQGWKLRVTSLAEESTDVLRLALPVLCAAGTPFTFLIDPFCARLANGADGWAGADGGLLTVHPLDLEQFRAVGSRLAAALRGRTGPEIRADRRWPGSTAVGYHYGGFARAERVGPDGRRGLVIAAPDGGVAVHVPSRCFTVPPWESDPFPAGPAEPDEPLRARYAVPALDARGGARPATDARTGRDVVLKEARAGVLVGSPGRPAIEVLEKEYQLLGELADTGLFARPVELVRTGGRAVLVRERPRGTPFGRYCLRTNPLVTLDLDPASVRGHFLGLRGLWRRIAEAVSTAHRRGILLGDLSCAGVSVDPETGTATVVGLETGVREGLDAHLGVHTPGTASPRLLATGRYDQGADWDALGALIFSSVMAVGGATGFHRPSLSRFLAELAYDLVLPAELVDLIDDLTAGDTVIDGPKVIQRIDELPFEGHPLWSTPVPLALPATDQYRHPERLPGLRDADLAEVAEKVVDYAVELADPRRQDRLYPADAAVFDTNPLSVAHGALGVLYGIHRLRGSVPAAQLGWAMAQDVDPARYPAGLYLGQAGVAWVLDELGRPEAALRLLDRTREHPLRFAAPGVLHGSAGYGLACLRLWQRQGVGRLLDDARAAGQALAADCLQDASGARWAAPAEPGGEPHSRVGHGHGAAGIALFLLYLHLATGEQQWYELGRSALAFELRRGIRVNGYGGEDDGLPGSCWETGTAGTATTALRYLVVRPEPGLAASVSALLADTTRKYSAVPGLFHGLSGLGNVLLDAGELLGEERWFAEARRVAQGVLLSRTDRAEGVVFPGGRALRESTDFATGSIGVALFLDRLRTAHPGGRSNFNFVLDELLP
ncbi:class III lanthionine synthetase LanKC N-terminal domain-containing protein [Kitasatospora mediocidica]|uniref:class III lanthionine synthetase LanKC N-terminal domain-containing protein n=1 Tax=Kitasatospora mediocidica TaxID=58352 RepID=UPI00055EA35B|nr:lanthionine synthetase LanC family protein [Kitasatospora mediocidica]